MGKPAYWGLVLAVPIIHLALKSIRKNDGQRAIRTVMPQYGTLVRTITILGKAITKTKENIIAEIPGILAEIMVEDGEVVKNGQELIKINSSQQEEKYLLAKQKIIATQLEVGQTQKELERLANLYKLDQISEREIDEVKQKLTGLQEALRIDQQMLALQKQKLDRAFLHAPVSGMVLFAGLLEKGDLINAGQLLFSIANAVGVNIEAQLNQDDASKINVGQEVSFKCLTENQENLLRRGRISFIAPEIKMGLIKIIVVPDENLQARLGSALEVSLELRSPKRTLIVPIETIRILEEETCIFTIENGFVKKCSVIVGEHNHNFIEIIDSDHLSEKSTIIASHFDDIEAGMKFDF
jgi:RND family efflux transporter MFP subunit